VGIAEFVEIEQLGRQRFAAGVSLTLVLIDMYFEFSGHSTKLPLCRRLRALYQAAAGSCFALRFLEVERRFCYCEL
jgi:hypothetical protein